MSEPTTAQRLAWQAAQTANEENKDREKLQDLSRRTELLREAAKAIERSSTDLEMAFGTCIATRELDDLASRIRKELGDE